LSDPLAPRLQAAVLGLAGVLAAASALGTLLAPYLLVKNPLLLVAISPAAHHVVLAAASVDPLPLLLVATLRRALFGVGAYGLGLLYGRKALGWVAQRQPRILRLLGWAERLFERFGLLLLTLAPAPTLAFFAGTTRKPFAWVVPALLVGHTLWNAAALWVGDALASRTELLTDFVGEHLLESTLLCAGIVVLRHLFRRFASRSPRAAD
jgi:hypothetical protein